MEAEPGIEPRYTDLQAVDFEFFMFIKQYLIDFKVETHSLNPLPEVKGIFSFFTVPNLAEH